MNILGILGLAFSSGVVSFLNPCSFALLPAYISYYLGTEQKINEKAIKLDDAIRGAKFGALATLGFTSIFGLIGFLSTLIGFKVRTYIPHFLLITSLSLIILGIFWITEILNFSFTFPFQEKISFNGTSFFLFGTAYGLGSMACIFPVFLMIIFTAINTAGFYLALLVFLTYATGMGTMMILVSIAISLSKKTLLEKLRVASKHVKKVSGGILIIAGFYILYYWYISFKY